MTSEGDNIGQELLAQVRAIEALEAQIADLNSAKSDIYRGVKIQGLNAKALRAVIRRRRLDPYEREEADAAIRSYEEAVEQAAEREASRARAREGEGKA